MWPTLSSFWVSSLMTCRLSSLKFLRLWRTGRTFGSMVRRWHRKLGSMSGWPCESIHVPCYDLDNLVMCFLAQRFSKLELLTPDLSLQHFLCRLGSYLPGNLETGDPFFPWRLGGDWSHSSLCLEAILIAPLGLLLIRFHGDHDSFKGRQLHLHMPQRGHCSNPVQSRSAKKNVIGWRSVNDKIPDVGGAGLCVVCEGHPQFYVPPHFYLVSCETVQVANVRYQMVGRQLQLVEGRPKHHVGRASLIYEDVVHLSAYCHHCDQHGIIVMWDHILQVSSSEDEVGLGRLVWPLPFHCHHSSGVLLTLGSGTPSSREFSSDSVDFSMDGHLVPLISYWGRCRQGTLRLLQVVL